jgi:hypothetical protein
MNNGVEEQGTLCKKQPAKKPASPEKMGGTNTTQRILLLKKLSLGLQL